MPAIALSRSTAAGKSNFSFQLKKIEGIPASIAAQAVFFFVFVVSRGRVRQVWLRSLAPSGLLLMKSCRAHDKDGFEIPSGGGYCWVLAARGGKNCSGSASSCFPELTRPD